VAGLFITLEGIDGCGKTTQARLLAERLRGSGLPVRLTREPGGTEAGEGIRTLLLSPDRTVPPGAELFLYLADRSIHITDVVRPALAEDGVVVCERHTDSTLAYQGYGRGLDLALLRQLNVLATGGVMPDLTIVLDLDPTQARLDASRLDRLESEGEAFLTRVAEGFRRLARDEPERIKLVDGSGAVEVVQAEVAELVEALLARRQGRGGQAKEGR
jgi:dTMP kinase